MKGRALKLTTQRISYLNNYRSLIENCKLLYTPQGLSLWKSHVATYPDCHERRKDLLAAGLQYARERNWPVLEMPNYKNQKLWGGAVGLGTDKVIFMNPNMPSDMEVLVLIHEMAHHDANHTQIGPNRPKLKRERELIAETIAYLVMAELGVCKFRRTSGYIASYYGVGFRLLQVAADRQESNILRSAQTIYDGVSQYILESKTA